MRGHGPGISPCLERLFIWGQGPELTLFSECGQGPEINNSCALDPPQGQRMYFLVNASHPKPLNVATSNFLLLKRSHDLKGTGQHFV